ncbi:hypothetical protein D030_3053B, partial [Vibrio parahaemolyticus AQ3810]
NQMLIKTNLARLCANLLLTQTVQASPITRTATSLMKISQLIHEISKTSPPPSKNIRINRALM